MKRIPSRTFLAFSVVVLLITNAVTFHSETQVDILHTDNLGIRNPFPCPADEVGREQWLLPSPGSDGEALVREGLQCHIRKRLFPEGLQKAIVKSVRRHHAVILRVAF